MPWSQWDAPAHQWLSNSSSYSVRMRENTDQNNSKYGRFSRSESFNMKLILTSVFKNNSSPRTWLIHALKLSKINWTWQSQSYNCVWAVLYSKSSFNLKARLRCTIEKNIQFPKLNVIFRSPCRLANLFKFKNFFREKNPVWNILPLYV